MRARRRKIWRSSLVQSAEFPRYVRTDAAKLRQVLINLLGNAVKYTRKGIDDAAAGRRRQPTQPDDVRLTFEVEDTGIGIAPEDQERIFEPFVQVGKPARRKAPGWVSPSRGNSWS